MVQDHRHLIVRALTNRFPKDVDELKKWIVDLVENIKMELAKGLPNNPSVYYCSQEGNTGLTGFAIIETSHIAIHIWDEDKPNLVQLDVYSCSGFALETVFEHFSCFDPVSIHYKYLDRNDRLIEVNAGNIIS
jgi:S-adenosylmethionine/arginine decarboxylase-like enzyme